MSAVPPRLGWVGLGAIGLPMAARAVAGGQPVLAWDPVAERRREAARAGIEIAADVAAVGAGCGPLVVCVVRSAEQVEAALLGRSGALREAGQTGLVMSSVGAETMRGLGRRAAAESRFLLDAPILGNPAAAAAGTLLVPLAGEPSRGRGARDVLEGLGSVVDAGPELGAAQAIKDVSQQLQIVGMLAAVEGMRLAGAEGVEAGAMLGILARTEPSWATENWEYAESLWRRAERQSSLGLFAKDLESALRDARAAGIEMPLTQRGLELLEERLDAVD